MEAELTLAASFSLSSGRWSVEAESEAASRARFFDSLRSSGETEEAELRFRLPHALALPFMLLPLEVDAGEELKASSSTVAATRSSSSSSGKASTLRPGVEWLRALDMVEAV